MKRDLSQWFWRTSRSSIWKEMMAAMMIGSLTFQTLHAAAPPWWATRGVHAPGSPAVDDFAALNQGQLKNFVRAAIEELHEKAPAGAGTELNAMLARWRAPRTGRDDYSVVTVGQLKAIAKPVYDALVKAGVSVQKPWSVSVSDDDDFAVANIGQAKRVFSFSVSAANLFSLNDRNGDGILDVLQLVDSSGNVITGSSAGNTNVGTNGAGGMGWSSSSYPDPYPNPLPATSQDPPSDSDKDGVQDALDAVPYDDEFQHPPTGFAHYMIVDMGRANGGLSSMSNGGALLWRPGPETLVGNEEEDQDERVESLKLMRVWTPSHPQPVEFEWDNENSGLSDALFATAPGCISDEGELVGLGLWNQGEGQGAKRRFFSYNPFVEAGDRAAWLPEIVQEDDEKVEVIWGEFYLRRGLNNEPTFPAFYQYWHDEEGSVSQGGSSNGTGIPPNGNGGQVPGAGQGEGSSQVTGGGGSGGSSSGRNTANPPSKPHPETRRRMEREERERERKREKERQKDPPKPKEDPPQPPPPPPPDPDDPPPAPNFPVEEPEDNPELPPIPPLWDGRIDSLDWGDYEPSYDDLWNSPLTTDEERLELLQGIHPRQPEPEDTPESLPVEGSPLNNASHWIPRPATHDAHWTLGGAMWGRVRVAHTSSHHDARLHRAASRLHTSRRPLRCTGAQAPETAAFRVREYHYAFARLQGSIWSLDEDVNVNDIPPLPTSVPDTAEPVGTEVCLGDSKWTWFSDASSAGIPSATLRKRIEMKAKTYATVVHDDEIDMDVWRYGRKSEETGNVPFLAQSLASAHELTSYETTTYLVFNEERKVDLVTNDDVKDPDTWWEAYGVRHAGSDTCVTMRRLKEKKNDEGDYVSMESEAYLFVVDSSGKVEKRKLYAGWDEFDTQAPLKSVGFITPQGQILVRGYIEMDGSYATGLWADGTALPMRKLVAGHSQYYDWDYHGVTRDGAIIATAKNGNCKKLLMLVPFQAREVDKDGAVANTGGRVQTSLPSPVIEATCNVNNVRLLADGRILGDVQISGAVVSELKDRTSGTGVSIVNGMLWINGADEPAGTLNTGGGSIQGSFSGIQLSEGVNVIKVTAEDSVYHIPGYSEWTVSVSVETIDTGLGSSGGQGGVGGPGTRVLSVQLGSGTLSPSSPDTATIGMTLAGNTYSNIAVVETGPATQVFTGMLGAGVPVRLTLAGADNLSLTVPDAIAASVVAGLPGAADGFYLAVIEQDAGSGLFIGTALDTALGNGSNLALNLDGAPSGSSGSSGGSGGSSGGGSGPPGTGSLGSPSGAGAPISVATFDSQAEFLAKSNGGELHQYAFWIGLSPALKDHFSMSFDGHSYELMQGGMETGMLLKDPAGSNAAFLASFKPGENGVQEADSKHDQRMREMEHVGFAKGFALGLGYGGADMVTGTGDVIAGGLKFMGRGFLGIGVGCRWTWNWATGGDTWADEELLIELGEPNAVVVDQGLAVGKFLGTLLIENAQMQQQITFALLSGNLDGVMTALHGSEVHRKIFSMAAEAIEGTMQDLSDGTEGQKGYVIGRIVFEVGSMVFPAAKAGLLAKLSKVEVINHLMTKGRLMGAKARQFMTAVRTPLLTTRMCFVAGTLVKAKQGAVKIEEVQPGMEVWSRDEFTQQEGWKPVAQTFITHPAELHHLTYELRGPPERGPLSPSVASETLGVTAPHPFWVSNRSTPGFVPAGELRAGDELRLANGGRAIVTANTQETAPLGETFTTYNFEVADFHTYFAGRGEVWVHNDGVAACQLARAGIEAMFQKTSNAWDAFRYTLGGFTHSELSAHTRLKIFNETRAKVFAGVFSGGQAPWKNLVRQKRTIHLPGAKQRQIDGLAGSSEDLGKNIIASGVEAPWKGGGGSPVAAHHIVMAGAKPPAYESARRAREILANADIDINEAANGVFLPRAAANADLGAAIHNGFHPKRYSDWVLEQLEPFAGNPDALRTQLQKIAAHLTEHGWP